jgi:hypothetical protein
MPQHTPTHCVRHESLEEIHDPEKREKHKNCERGCVGPREMRKREVKRRGAGSRLQMVTHISIHTQLLHISAHTHSHCTYQPYTYGRTDMHSTKLSAFLLHRQLLLVSLKMSASVGAKCAAQLTVYRVIEVQHSFLLQNGTGMAKFRVITDLYDDQHRGQHTTQ